jgi:thiosulfate/3-mercaptopyruvate sulfurtransferase
MSQIQTPKRIVVFGATGTIGNLPMQAAIAFKSREELEKIYQEDLGYKPAGDTIVYCRIGERASHTWFVLTRLLGFEKVRNYDGSWTEWGNMVRTPVEKP